MTVGTDIGNTYKGQQGTGFATVIGYNPQVDLSIAQMKQQKEELAAQEKAAKEKKLMDAYGQMAKIKPDNWYVHDKEVSDMMTGLIDLGASMLQRGDDPFTSSSPDAVKFQKLQQEIARTGEYSKQFQKAFGDAQTAFKNGEELENWDEIVTWFHNPSITEMVHSGERMPKPIFKKPEVSTFLTINEYADKWRLNNKEKIPSTADFTLLAKELINDPTKSSGFASTNSKFQQRFSILSDEQKEALSARGAKNGGIDGYTQYVAEQFKALMDPNFNIGERIIELAKKEGLSDSKKETGDVTKFDRYSKMTDADILKVIRPELQDGAVQRDVDMGLYGDPSKDISFNIKAAERYYIPLYRKNRETQHSVTTDEGGKDKAKYEEGGQQWLSDIRGKNGKAAQDNARERLRGITLPGGEVTLTFGDESNPDQPGKVLTLASEKISVEEGENVKRMSGTPINVETATDEQLLRYLRESDKLHGKPYKSKATETDGTPNDPPASKSSNSTGAFNNPPK